MVHYFQFRGKLWPERVRCHFISPVRRTVDFVQVSKEWRDKVNAYRAKKKMKPLYLKEPCRNKYVSCLTYKGKRYEFGAFDDPESATAEYLAKKEGFIQDRLREYWSAFLFA